MSLPSVNTQQELVFLQVNIISFLCCQQCKPSNSEICIELNRITSNVIGSTYNSFKERSSRIMSNFVTT